MSGYFWSAVCLALGALALRFAWRAIKCDRAISKRTRRPLRIPVPHGEVVVCPCGPTVVCWYIPHAPAVETKVA